MRLWSGSHRCNPFQVVRRSKSSFGLFISFQVFIDETRRPGSRRRDRWVDGGAASWMSFRGGSVCLTRVGEARERAVGEARAKRRRGGGVSLLARDGTW